jgi:hypothetical protein
VRCLWSTDLCAVPLWCCGRHSVRMVTTYRPRSAKRDATAHTSILEYGLTVREKKHAPPNCCTRYNCVGATGIGVESARVSRGPRSRKNIFVHVRRRPMTMFHDSMVHACHARHGSSASPHATCAGRGSMNCATAGHGQWGHAIAVTVVHTRPRPRGAQVARRPVATSCSAPLLRAPCVVCGPLPCACCPAPAAQRLLPCACCTAPAAQRPLPCARCRAPARH